ncbi:MAG TPA: glycosyl hydrolase [Bacteroidales bacterium]|nr:glycosyl hydrolase [Bacteroidales bacterium]
MKNHSFSLARFIFKAGSFILAAIFLSACSGPADKTDMLRDGFMNPPQGARPRVWWHWMNGNITKEGIKADLQWMHRVGIGGFQNFDASLLTPQVVKQRLVYMTPEWKDAFRFTAGLADSLGLEMAIAGSPGWSESGGPWVKPFEGMKKYAWSETQVEGGKTFRGMLAMPPKTTGTFQNIPMGGDLGLNGGRTKPAPEFYADAAVFAYKVPASSTTLEDLQPKVTSSGGRFNLKMLTDGDLSTSSFLPSAKVGEKSWIQFEFKQPETISGLSIVGGGAAGQFGFGADPDNRALESGNDGKSFTKVIDIHRGGVAQTTLTFAPVTARFFRFTWKTPPPSPVFNLGELLGIDNLNMPKAPQGTQVAELVLYRIPPVNHFEEKAAFSTAGSLYSLPSPEIRKEDAIRKSDVIDLTSKMKPDGSLEWTPPEGRWVIVRLGYTLTGHTNHPASEEATGLEVDKLSAVHVKAYFNNYLDQYKDATGGLMGSRGLQYMITDSWEAGVQNWTDSMMTEFSRRRGYEMLPWLPVLTGRIVESSEESDRFLWDLRKTIGDLTTINHYDQLTTILRERGMGRYTESHEGGRAFIGDGMEVKSMATFPMSATWTPGKFGRTNDVSTGYKADVRESASVAHLYGQNIVAAESMTAIGTAWAWAPELLKPTADMELSNGLNRFVIHTSVHQPVDDKIPGLGLGPFGQWFTRHETWAEQAGPWITYLARSSYMLQQGKFVADILYYYGEDNNITSLFDSKLPDIPSGYNYDFVNSDALVNLLSVSDGHIVTASGMSYNLLVLDSNSVYMTLPVLRKLRGMVREGAVVSGPKPVSSPSLSDDQKEFSTIANELWANSRGETVFGKGKVIAGLSAGEALASLGIRADFEYKGSLPDSKLLFVHRRTENADIYWVDNRINDYDDALLTFRVEGRKPELWNPVSGKIEPAAYKMENGTTTVPLKLEPDATMFIVFREKTGKKEVSPVPQSVTSLSTLDGPWSIAFQKDRGAPDSIRVDKLASLSSMTDPGVKYFSGTASYTRSIDAPAEWFSKGGKLVLDLGEVKYLAEIILNGKSMGIVWKTPFTMDVSGALVQGRNKLEIKVTDLWVNRLIGDARPGVSKKITYTTMPFYRANSPLLPSGLLGPVTIKLVSENQGQ